MADFCLRTSQTMPHERGAMARMVYESLALKYRMVDEMIAKVCGLPSEEVHIVGGGSRNELLNRFAADATGKPVIAGPVEATAIGNILVQAVGLGTIKNLKDAMPMIRKAFPITEYKPSADPAWRKAYERFLKIVKKNA